MKVVLVGARLCRNLGGPSLLVSTRIVLEKFIDELECVLVSPASEDVSFSDVYDIEVVPNASGRELLLSAMARALLGISIGSKDVCKVVDVVARSDAMIDIWGLSFSAATAKPTFRTAFLQGIHFLVAKLFHKPVIKYTADLGPFESGWHSLFSRLYLQYTVDLILARSEATERRVRELGISTPMRVCPDTAFFLPSDDETRLARELTEYRTRPNIVGVSISHMAARQSGDLQVYSKCMAELADYIVEAADAVVLLIPNELSEKIEYDDSYIAEKILDRMEMGREAIIASGEHTASQLKGIIGLCDLMIAARYHSIVASLSQGIPVLALSWHAKYLALMRLFGQDEYVCSVNRLEQKDLRSKFDELWAKRRQLQLEIEAALVDVRESISRSGREVARFLLDTGDAG